MILPTVASGCHFLKTPFSLLEISPINLDPFVTQHGEEWAETAGFNVTGAP